MVLGKKLAMMVVGLALVAVATVVLLKKSTGSQYEMEEDYEILHQCSFDRYFTQGSQILDDGKTLAISTGLYGSSSINLFSFDFETCEIEEIFDQFIDTAYFGEGLAIAEIDGEYTGYQLTYKEDRILKWNFEFDDVTGVYTPTFEEALQMPSNNQLNEGWGIAYRQPDNSSDTGKLYTTDGSSNIYVIDPITWDTIDTISVVDDTGSSISNLNELEIINTDELFLSRYVFANVWQNSYIYMIDLETGISQTMWDLDELMQNQYKHLDYSASNYYWANAVLNGIAYYPENDSFVVTGKLWDFIYEVKLNYRNFVEEE